MSDCGVPKKAHTYKHNITLPCTVKRDYLLTELIGSGGFGRVYRARNLTYNLEFAVKVLEADGENKERIYSYYKAEVNALTKLDHPNIIRLYDNFQIDDLLFLVLEYCPNGTITIANGAGVPKHALNEICCEIVNALEYCHSMGIAHRDIKPSNFLIDSFGRVKLIDFGLSLEITPGMLIAPGEGSYIYASPEIFRREKYDPFKSDVWSLGVMIYLMATGRPLFPLENLDTLSSAIMNCIFPPISTGNKDIDSILRKMLTLSPKTRLTMKQVKAKFSPQINQFGNTLPISRKLRRIRASDSELFSGAARSIISSNTQHDIEAVKSFNSLQGPTIRRTKLLPSIIRPMPTMPLIPAVPSFS